MTILFDPFEEAEKLSLQNGRWVVGVIQTRDYWPHKRQLMNFKEKQFLLLPHEINAHFNTPTLPAIALNADLFGLKDAEARKSDAITGAPDRLFTPSTIALVPSR